MAKPQARVAFIFITALLDMIGIGVIIPSLPDIIRRFMSDPTEVSHYFGYFVSVYALMQFLASPLLGALSDLLGRRPVLLISLAVAAADYVLMAFAPTLLILFASRVIAGLTGANMTVAMAYLSDITPPEKRAASFGLIGAAFGLGFILGPAIGGLLGDLGPQAPFLVAAGLNGLNFLFGLFVLPESLPKNKRRKFSLPELNPLRALGRTLATKEILLLVACFFMFCLAGQTHPSIWTLYTQTRFGWTPSQVGMSLAVVGILSAMVQGGLVRVIVPKLGEMRAVRTGALIGMFAFLGFGLAPEGWMMIAILIPSSLGWIANPALQSMISQRTPPERHGELQGSMMAMQSLSSILNPLITTTLFGLGTAPGSPYQLPGAPYFFAAAVSASCWLMMMAVHQRSTRRSAAVAN
jgi:DHA1 family tetracycline resistance protein-like MFS transporter